MVHFHRRIFARSQNRRCHIAVDPLQTPYDRKRVIRVTALLVSLTAPELPKLFKNALFVHVLRYRLTLPSDMSIVYSRRGEPNLNDMPKKSKLIKTLHKEKNMLFIKINYKKFKEINYVHFKIVSNNTDINDKFLIFSIFSST
jgi:hypothetical protein